MPQETDVLELAPPQIAEAPVGDRGVVPPQTLEAILKERSGRALRGLQTDLLARGLLTGPTAAALEKRCEDVRRLLRKTRTVAWVWANVYGYGQDDLFPAPLHGREAAYLAVVQAGVILVLDKEYRRIACCVTDDGRVWTRYAIRRRTSLNPRSLYLCKIKRFSPAR